MRISKRSVLTVILGLGLPIGLLPTSAAQEVPDDEPVAERGDTAETMQDAQGEEPLADDPAARGDSDQEWESVTIIDPDGQAEWTEETGDFPGDETQEADFEGEGFQDDLPIVARPVAISAPAPPPPNPLGMVPRVSMGVRVKENAAKFQAQIAYTIDPRSWNPPYEGTLPRKSSWELKHICGGVLIDTDWVLTAAHCVNEDNLERGLSVVLGAEDISKPSDGTAYRVDRIVIHANYTKYENDIALVHLAPSNARRDPAQVATIPLYTGADLPMGTGVSGLGWGRTQEAGPEIAPSAVLWRADQKLIPANACRQRPDFGAVNVNGRSLARITDRVVCAGDTPSKTCSGDSGGPLLLNSGGQMLVGIVSWNKRDCSNPANPGVYTKVSAFAGWITKAKATAANGGTVQRIGD